MRTLNIFFAISLALLLGACSSTPNWDSYSPVEAENLQAMGVSVSDANAYREMGFNSETIKRWHDAGITDRRTVTTWHDAGFPAVEAGAWKGAGFDLKTAMKWRDAGFNAEEAKDWASKDFDLKEATKLRSKGLSAD